MYQQKPLRVSEGSLFLQAAFEGFSPQQIQLRELLVETGWAIECESLNDFLKDLGERGSAEWLNTIREAPNKTEATITLFFAMFFERDTSLVASEVEARFVEGHDKLTAGIKALVEEKHSKSP